ncbi:MAG: hypothetical protein ACOC0O_07290 [Spirochaetota bacterium]
MTANISKEAHFTVRTRVVVVALALLAVAPALFANGAPEAEAFESGEYTVWTGERITFTKPDGADPTLAENQDRITESVWITRGNSGGQIYNAVERNRAVKSTSPVGTYWAVGTTDDLPDLEFAPFRSAVGSPKDVEGKDLVLFIEAEGIFIDVRFTSWSQEKRGGFAYERSTPE